MPLDWLPWKRRARLRAQWRRASYRYYHKKDRTPEAETEKDGSGIAESLFLNLLGQHLAR